jgi:uncharacterized protein (UPF0210 family)/Pyruvate/2-oxoacid:ferredoxin oxidoreductase delta subunit
VLIAIVSGKGGTGKTAVATALAQTLVRTGLSISCLDCDVEAPNAHIFIRPNLLDCKPVEMLIPQVDANLCTGCGECAKVCQFHAICVPLQWASICLIATEQVCASVNVGTTRSGINMDAIAKLGQTIKELSEHIAGRDGFAAAKFVVFTNQPGDNPFMAGAVHGIEQHEVAINVGVSGPGVIARSLERKIAQSNGDELGLHELADEIKRTAFRVTRSGELVGRRVAKALGVPLGVVDLSLAPTPKVGDSIGEILKIMGVDAIGAPGSTAIIAILNDAVKKGESFASQSVGELSGAFIPVCEDHALADAVRDGSLTLEKLEAMTSVCSVGLDMIAIPGSVDADTIAAIIADEMVIGMINSKTTAVRIIPVPNKEVGDFVSFGGLFGEIAIAQVRNAGKSTRFVNLGGKIPAPIHSLRN